MRYGVVGARLSDFNFIGAFEVPADVVTPMEQEAERRQQEEQAEKEERSKALAQARYEKYKQERRSASPVSLQGAPRRQPCQPVKTQAQPVISSNFPAIFS